MFALLLSSVASLFSPPSQAEVRNDSTVMIQEIFDQLKAVYARELTAHPYSLELEILDHSVSGVGSVDRDVRKKIDTIIVGLPPETLRSRTAIGIALCHELGHLIGGSPQQVSPRNFSFEGQADYFTFAKCVRRLWASDDNAQLISELTLDPRIAPLCAESFPTPTPAFALCVRSVHAAFTLAVEDLHPYYVRVKRKSEAATPPDLRLTSAYVGTHLKRPFTLSQHTNSQCRLETMVAGALCAVDPTSNFKNGDPNAGACASGTPGGRPACWYVTPSETP